MPNGGHLTLTMLNAQIADNHVPGLVSGKYLKVMVQDEGHGIDSERINQVFDPYFSTKETGTGLGLTTCYSIMRRHNGHISMESTLNIGTLLTLYLPATGETSAPTETLPITDRNPRPQLGSALVLDDDEMILKVTRKMLVELGYKVTTAKDGETAIEQYKAADHKFDLVILDLTIPGGMGGKDTAASILSLNSTAKIIVSSGYSADPVMANYEEYGFADVLAKPYSIERLQEVIDPLAALDPVA